MDPLKIIEKYYKDNPLYDVFLKHAQAVTKFALNIAKNVPELKPDLQFIKEAAMLHDIGVNLVKCSFGNTSEPYIKHGVLGAELLRKEKLEKHALVCERHIGVGLSLKKINAQNLPLPKRDMTPQTVEEEIITFADLFFSKSEKYLEIPRPIEEARKKIATWCEDDAKVFDEWVKKYNLT